MVCLEWWGGDKEGRGERRVIIKVESGLIVSLGMIWG